MTRFDLHASYDAACGAPLLESAAALTQMVDCDSRPEPVVQTVRVWGERLRQRIAADTSALNRLRLLNHFFFGELGFRGPGADDDPARVPRVSIHEDMTATRSMFRATIAGVFTSHRGGGRRIAAGEAR
mgnify:CR=1 FL=1